MYEKLLKELEVAINGGYRDFPKETPLGDVLDIIIKIKTIQALDTSADLIRASRQVGRN